MMLISIICSSRSSSQLHCSPLETRLQTPFSTSILYTTMSFLQFPLCCVTTVQVMMFSYLACVCPPSTCFTKSLCFICFGQHNQWVYYDGVIIVPTLILFFCLFCLFPRRKLPRTYWPSSTLVVTHIALSMCIVFTCPPSWVLEEMQRDKNTKRVSSEIVPLETSECKAVPFNLSGGSHFFTVRFFSRFLQAPQSAHWRDGAISSPGPLLTRWPAGRDWTPNAEAPPERHGRLWPVPTNPPAVPQPHQWHSDLSERRLPARHRLQQQPVLRLLRVLLLHGGRAPHGRRLQRLQIRPSRKGERCVQRTARAVIRSLIVAAFSESFVLLLGSC